MVGRTRGTKTRYASSSHQSEFLFRIDLVGHLYRGADPVTAIVETVRCECPAGCLEVRSDSEAAMHCLRTPVKGLRLGAAAQRWANGGGRKAHLLLQINDLAVLILDPKQLRVQGICLAPCRPGDADGCQIHCAARVELEDGKVDEYRIQ